MAFNEMFQLELFGTSTSHTYKNCNTSTTNNLLLGPKGGVVTLCNGLGRTKHINRAQMWPNFTVTTMLAWEFSFKI